METPKQPSQRIIDQDKSGQLENHNTSREQAEKVSEKIISTILSDGKLDADKVIEQIGKSPTGEYLSYLEYALETTKEKLVGEGKMSTRKAAVMAIVLVKIISKIAIENGFELKNESYVQKNNTELNKTDEQSIKTEIEQINRIIKENQDRYNDPGYEDMYFKEPEGNQW